MTRKTLPAINIASRPTGVSADLPPSVMARWNPDLRAAVSTDEASRTISIYEPIGLDYWTGEGMTAKRISAALRAIGPGKDVIVNINSPGGDVFEGLAIYNLLRDYEGTVTTRVMGLAASAASFIAMAGDTRQIGRAAFFMIHNGWIVCVGNRNDMRAAADWIEPFDRTIADIYAVASGQDAKQIGKLMDAETWIGGASAVEQGFADDFLPADAVNEQPSNNSMKAVRALDAALAKTGMPRSERRRLLTEFKGMQDAAPDGTPSAANDATLPAGRPIATGQLASLAAGLRAQLA